jgi:hypothetical protein
MRLTFEVERLSSPAIDKNWKTGRLPNSPFLEREKIAGGFECRSFEIF